MVALLRGVNVGGKRKVPMTELCASLTKAGLTEVESYINSGNLIFEAGRLKPQAVVALVEQTIQTRFGSAVETIVRTAAQWKKYSAGSPFPGAARTRAKMLHLGLAQDACASDAALRLADRAVYGEKIKIVGDAIWVDFAESVAKSKLTPAWFDKIIGSTVTFRNWNTVLKLEELLQAPD